MQSNGFLITTHNFRYFLLVVTCVLSGIIRSWSDDTLNSIDTTRFARFKLDLKNLYMDGNVVLTPAHYSSGSAELINTALRKANKQSIHFQTFPGVPYSQFHAVLSLINRSDNRSLTLCTEDPEEICFTPGNEEESCSYRSDSIHLSVAVDKKSTIILYGNGIKEIIPHYNGTINKLEAGSLLMKLSMEYRCAADIRNITIAATDYVPFSRILEIIQAAFNSGFQKLSFALIRPEAIRYLYDSKQRQLISLFDHVEPVYYSSDISNESERYFNEVIRYFESIGKQCSRQDAHEYTGRVLLVSFPPLAEIYLDSSFIGFTNRSPLYFKPGSYIVHIRKDFQYAEQEILVNPGENPSISIHLHDLPEDLASSSTPLFPVHFDTTSFQMTGSGKGIIKKFDDYYFISQKKRVRMVIIKCTQSPVSLQKITDHHITIVLRELQKKGISKDSIITEIRKINEDYCIEAIYLTCY